MTEDTDEKSITQTETEIPGDAPDGSVGPDRVESLLGNNGLQRRTRAPQKLLRIAGNEARSALFERFGFAATGTGPWIMGPFSEQEIKDFLEARLLRNADEVLTSFDRWRSVRDAIEGAEDYLAPNREDLTQTQTQTETMTGTGTPSGSGGQTRSGVIELEEVVDEIVVPHQIPPAARYSPESKAAEARPEVTAPAAKAPIPERAAGPRRVEPAPSSSSGGWMVPLLVVVAVGFGGYTLIMKKKERAVESEPSADVRETSQKAAIARVWPESLRPRSADTLVAGDSALVKKIRPILLSYERGSLFLSGQDEQSLRSAADPASGSWDARKMAANMLAVFFLGSQKTEEAKSLLRPILESAANDVTTLLNLSLIALGEGDGGQAKQFSEQALQNCTGDECWLPNVVSGMALGQLGEREGLNLRFRKASELSVNNPFIYGLWINELIRLDPNGAGQVPSLVREALVSDPDRLIDTPIHAPLAGHVLIGRALDGLAKGASFGGSKLSQGQAMYMRWLEARFRQNPLSQPLSQVLDSLALEADPISQILYAYALRDRGSLDESSKVLSRALPLFEGKREFSSSWPWTLAGDVQFARGEMDQALISYNSALSRQPRDPGALLGLALIFREKNDYSSSEQKLSEVLSADSHFTPAILRISRFEWQSLARSR